MGAAATLHPKVLVPSGHLHYPSWMAGPFRGYGDRVPIHELDRLLIILVAMYVVVLACSRVLPAWIAVAGVVVLTVLFALAPPLFSTEIFNYVNYARLGVLHHINPYRHGAAAFTAAGRKSSRASMRWCSPPTRASSGINAERAPAGR